MVGNKVKYLGAESIHLGSISVILFFNDSSHASIMYEFSSSRKKLRYVPNNLLDHTILIIVLPIKNIFTATLN